MVIEARYVRLVKINLGDIAVHPFRDRARNAGTLLDPTRGDRPQPLHLGCLPSTGCPSGVIEISPLMA